MHTPCRGSVQHLLVLALQVNRICLEQSIKHNIKLKGTMKPDPGSLVKKNTEFNITETLQYLKSRT